MFSNNGYRAVLFDLDGTLLLDNPSPIAHFFACCARLGYTFDGDAPRRLERWQHQYWSDRNLVESDLAQHGEEHFWTAYNVRQLDFVGVRGALADYARQIDQWFRDEYLPAPFIPDDVRSTLSQLRERGLMVALVSNRTRSLEPVVAHHGLDGLFDFTLSAGEAGSWKPDPGIFLQAAEKACVEPQAAVYVGDNYYADVVGARGAGLIPILIDRRGIFPDADCRVIHAISEVMELT